MRFGCGGRPPRVRSMIIGFASILVACSAACTGTAAEQPRATSPDAQGGDDSMPDQTEQEPRASYVSTFCIELTSLNDLVQAETEALASGGLPLSMAAFDASLDVIRSALATMSSSLDSAEPPLFVGSDALADRVEDGFARTLEALDEIDATVAGLSMDDPDYEATITGQAIGISFAIALVSLGLVDGDAVAGETDLPLEEVARRSQGYTGFMREALTIPECAYLVAGSEEEIMNLPYP